MYSIDGIPLDNDAQGWWLASESKPLSEYTRDLQALSTSGRDGVVAGLGGTIGPVTVPLVLETKRGTVERLLSLIQLGSTLTVTAVPSRSVRYEFAGSTYEHLVGAADAVVLLTVLLRFPGAYWRDVASTDISATMIAGATPVTAFTGMSAPIQDAIVRIRGAATAITVTDSGGSWVKFPNVATGNFARFDSATGRCYLTTSDTWSGGTEISGQVDFGGPRGRFEITPVLNKTTFSRVGTVSVSAASVSGAQVAVRGRAAYLI